MKPKRLEEKEGSIVIPIYEFADGRYCVDTIIEGKRKRITRSNLTEARFEARRIISQISTGRAHEKHLTSGEAEDYRLAMSKLVHFNRSLVTVVDEWIANHLRQKKLVEKKVPEVVEEFLASKKLDGVSSVHLADCQSRLRKFAQAFTSRIDEVTTTDIARWLALLGTSRRTQKNYRNLVLQLFRYARSRQYLPPREPTAVEDITFSKVNEGDILIYSLSEMTLLLAKAPDRLIPFLALGAFAGLRSQEIMRLEWKDIRFEQKLIEVSAKKAKTSARRLVPLLPVLAKWLQGFQKPPGRVMDYAHNSALTRARVAFCEGATPHGCTAEKFTWKPNALRHSYASYRLALIKDAGQVALEMGNSPSILFRNYRELVTEKEAKAWFALLPARVSRVSLPSPLVELAS